MLELELERKRYPFLEQIDTYTKEQRVAVEDMAQSIRRLYFNGIEASESSKQSDEYVIQILAYKRTVEKEMPNLTDLLVQLIFLHFQRRENDD